MKKILFVLFPILLLTSCDIILNEAIDYFQEAAVTNKSLYDGDFPEMKTFEEVAAYVMENIDYIQDDLLTPVAGPKESLERGYGDCDEFSLAFMNVAFFTLGIKFDFASTLVPEGSTANRHIGEGGIINHALVMLDGVLYSAYNGRPCPDLPISYYYYFDEVYTK